MELTLKILAALAVMAFAIWLGGPPIDIGVDDVQRAMMR